MMTSADDITNWLISEGRELGDGVAIVEGYSARLVEAGVPLSRANIAQRFANPLLVAWGVIWTPEETSQYDVTHQMLETSSYVGSPFEYVHTNLKPLHKSLVGLDPDLDHSSYLELAEAGGTDLYAMLLTYGDGSQNGCTFVTDSSNGFQGEHIALIQRTGVGLACALEPVTMRKSTESLLRTYIGDGPARAVCNGTIQRGESSVVEAVVVFTDLRGFTTKSETWKEEDLIEALNGYFDAVVQAVIDNGGDVLKFMGDGILSIFTIDENKSREAQCRRAIDAVRASVSSLEGLNKDRRKEGLEALAMGTGINVGSVTYGNIGSPGRLDFTVLGPAVNIASRVQDLCKSLDETALATEPVALSLPGTFEDRGHHSLRGVSEPIKLFAIRS